ncbi:MAG: hypothetical protein IPF54_03330 [Draconibacterium sp.]|nr:hypothetical protein [Draconibacterium sp.]
MVAQHGPNYQAEQQLIIFQFSLPITIMGTLQLEAMIITMETSKKPLMVAKHGLVYQLEQHPG